MGQPATPQIHECSHAASRTVPWPPAGATSPGWGRTRHSTGERCFCMVCTPAHRKTWCLPVKQTRRISPIWIALTNSGIRIITTMLPIAPSSRRHALHTGTLPFIPPPQKHQDESSNDLACVLRHHTPTCKYQASAPQAAQWSCAFQTSVVGFANQNAKKVSPCTASASGVLNNAQCPLQKPNTAWCAPD